MGQRQVLQAKLTEFHRTTSLVQANTGISDKQYVIQTPKYRRFLYIIMLLSRKATKRGNFEVLLKQKEWKIFDELTDIFFTEPMTEPRQSAVLFNSYVFACK